MELKGYQLKVLQDLDSYLHYYQEHKDLSEAFNRFWEDKIGPYNPLLGLGMQPYKTTVPKAASVCIKVPTAGGKTFIAVNALSTLFKHHAPGLPKTVVWLVPWSNLLDQTVQSLSNPSHPYRQRLNSLFNNRVEVYQKKDLLQGSNFNPTVVQEQLSIIVMSFASLRAKNKEDRKVYQENGQLASFAAQNSDQAHLLEGTDDTALINVIRSLNPVLVVDESHNAESELSIDMLKALNPSFILDLTATPKANSNIISLVPAIELKKEHMVKLPVIVYNHHDKTEVINSALHLQKKLETLAIDLQQKGGRYIRPIVLFQAQSRTADDNTTFEKLKEQLLKLQIPEEQIKIKTATIDELKGIDLMSKECQVRYIITVNALKEGWDCPFAYILASLADRSSAVDVEQILGRVLRQPYVMKHTNPLLNVSYVLTASAKFNETLQNIVKGLQSSGFSDKDYRQHDQMPEAQKPAVAQNPLESFLFPEQPSVTKADDDIDTSRISFDPSSQTTSAEDKVVQQIEQLAQTETRQLEQQIQQSSQRSDDNLFMELGDKVKRYSMRDTHTELARSLVLPQFFQSVPASSIFNLDSGSTLLNQEALLKNFRLADEDTKIQLDQIQSELYKIDLEETRKDEFAPAFTKIEDQLVKDPVMEYILAKPREGQIKDVTHQLMQLIGDLYPIPDQDIRLYVERILNRLNTEQIHTLLLHKLSFKDRLKQKIRDLANKYAEGQFNDLVTTGLISLQPSWKFPETIVPGSLAPSIGNSLYEREGKINGFEERVILDLGTQSNIAFWHRNLGRSKGFHINGFINHYPDFLLVTKRGTVVVLETKGDDRDNSDSEAKIRLGNRWSNLAGRKFMYLMVFEHKQVEGAVTLDKAKELLRMV
jgi:type III restriction enzyme